MNVDNLKKTTHRRQLVFSPQLGHLVAEHKTTSERVRSKFSDYFGWCFCELCGNETEFAVALTVKARGIFNSASESIPLTNAICDQAERIADLRAKSYERALGRCSRWPDVPIHLILKYCGVDGWRRLKSDELRDRESASESGHITVELFRLFVEGQERMRLWAKKGFIGVQPGRIIAKQSRAKDAQQESPLFVLSRAGEPSKFYCKNHNQQRNESARRNYQRDRQLAGEYQHLIQQIWSDHAGSLPMWDIAAHAHVRREAYRHLQAMKPRQHRSPTGKIAEMVAQGITNQSEIALLLGISRQAVSAAIKRHAGENCNR